MDVKPDIILYLFALSVIRVSSNPPSWRKALVKRINRLETKIYEESLEFRNELQVVATKLDGIQQHNSDFYNSSGETNAPVEMKDDQCFGEYVTRIENAKRQVTKAFQDEKGHIRKSLNDMEQRHGQVMDELLEGLEAMRKNTAKEHQELRLLIEKTQSSSERKISDVGDEIARNFDKKLEAIQTEMSEIRKYFNKTLAKKSCVSWEAFQDSCYFISTEICTWYEAKDTCLAMDAHLAEIGSAEEADFLKALARNAPSVDLQHGPWIGASDEGSEGNWVWDHSGTRLAGGFQDWKVSEPNGGTAENCLHMYSTHKYTWNDCRCNVKNRFLCEK